MQMGVGREAPCCRVGQKSDGDVILEDQYTDRKFMRTITGKTVDWNALVKDCVCFANGGQTVADRHSRSGAENRALKSEGPPGNPRGPAPTGNFQSDLRRRLA